MILSQAKPPRDTTHCFTVLSSMSWLLQKKGEMSGVMWVGVNMNALVLAENSLLPGQPRIIIDAFPWARVQKISFNRRRFSVQPRPDLGQMKPLKLNFYTTSYKK